METAPNLAALAALLTRDAGSAVSVEAVTALSGGAASMTYAVEARRDGEPWPLILQRAAVADPVEGAMPKRVQAALQVRARDAGLPVAEVVAVAAPGDGLGDAFVMARVDGETLAPRWLRRPEYAAARAAMPAQCGAALARLHGVPVAALAGLDLVASSPEATRARAYDLYRGFSVDVPAFDLAFAWLAGRLPDDPPATLVHGDFRSGNFIVGGDGLAAILDWELAHIGHPLEDLGWLCTNTWRFGAWDKPVGGFGDRDALYDAYEAAGGGRVDRELARAFELWGSLRWGVMCLQLAHAHLSGARPSIEMAAIGRRVSETEVDILYALKHGSL